MAFLNATFEGTIFLNIERQNQCAHTSRPKGNLLIQKVLNLENVLKIFQDYETSVEL